MFMLTVGGTLFSKKVNCGLFSCLKRIGLSLVPRKEELDRNDLLLR